MFSMYQFGFMVHEDPKIWQEQISNLFDVEFKIDTIVNEYPNDGKNWCESVQPCLFQLKKIELSGRTVEGVLHNLRTTVSGTVADRRVRKRPGSQAQWLFLNYKMGIWEMDEFSNILFTNLLLRINFLASCVFGNRKVQLLAIKNTIIGTVYSISSKNSSYDSFYL